MCESETVCVELQQAIVFLSHSDHTWVKGWMIIMKLFPFWSKQGRFSQSILSLRSSSNLNLSIHHVALHGGLSLCLWDHVDHFSLNHKIIPVHPNDSIQMAHSIKKQWKWLNTPLQSISSPSPWDYMSVFTVFHTIGWGCSAKCQAAHQELIQSHSHADSNAFWSNLGFSFLSEDTSTCGCWSQHSSKPIYQWKSSPLSSEQQQPPHCGGFSTRTTALLTLVWREWTVFTNIIQPAENALCQEALIYNIFLFPQPCPKWWPSSFYSYLVTGFTKFLQPIFHWKSPPKIHCSVSWWSKKKPGWLSTVC